jgi:hypothetical protein
VSSGNRPVGGHGLAHRAGPNHADSAAIQAAAIEDRPPAAKLPGSDQPVAAQNVAGEADHQADRQLRGRQGQPVGHDGEPYAPPLAGRDVEIVVALQGAGNDLQLRTGAWGGLVDTVRHEGHRALSVAAAMPKLVGRPDIACPMRHHLCNPLQEGNDLQMDPARQDGFWQHIV